MAITIKEIYVKTTVSREVSAGNISDEVIRQLKESILSELKEEELKKIRKKNER